MPAPIEQPSWRKPVGMFLILALIAVWAIIMLVFTPVILSLAWPLQALFFAIFGIAWIIPLKPLLRWMDQGKWRE
jgi:predicted membrane channel-forming protein YqfA (hemolysin III family)